MMHMMISFYGTVLALLLGYSSVGFSSSRAAQVYHTVEDFPGIGGESDEGGVSPRSGFEDIPVDDARKGEFRSPTESTSNNVPSKELSIKQRGKAYPTNNHSKKSPTGQASESRCNAM